MVNPLFIHNAQLNLYMPQDERYRHNLLLKIDNPPENKDEEEEKEREKWSDSTQFNFARQ